MRLVLILFLAFWPGAALAEGVPKSVVAKVNRDAQRYVDEVSVLIEGFGTAGAIDRQGLENVVGLARAEARALAFRRVQGADLDGDGIIAGGEVAVAAAAASAVARGRLLVHFAQADGDRDGQVTPPELQTYANDVALDAFSADKAHAVLAVLAFDGDGDGWVSVPEVQTAVAALASAKGNAREIHNQFQIQAHDDHRDQHGKRDQPARRHQPTHLGAI